MSTLHKRLLDHVRYCQEEHVEKISLSVPELRAFLDEWTEDKRKAAALDWLEATLQTADIDLHEQGGEYFCWAGDASESGLTVLEAIEHAMNAEKEHAR